MPSSGNRRATSAEVPSESMGATRPKKNWLTKSHAQSYIHLSIFVALSFTVNITRWVPRSKSHPHLTEAFTHVYVAILMFISCGLMCVCWRRNVLYWRDYPRIISSSNEHPISRLALISMVVFFIGSLFFDAVSVIALGECIAIYQAHSIPGLLTTLVLVTVILKPIYMAVQIAFLVWSGNWLLRYGGLINPIMFTFNSFINITLTIYNIFYESREIFGNDFNKDCAGQPGWEVNTTDMHTITPRNASYILSCSKHQTDFHKIENWLEPYLFSFHVEFYVLATSMNLILWKRIGHVGAGDHEEQNTDIARDCETEADGDGLETESHAGSYGVLSINDAPDTPIENIGRRQRGWSVRFRDFLRTGSSTQRPDHTTIDDAGETSALLPKETANRPRNLCRFCGIFGVCVAFVYALLLIIKKHHPHNVAIVSIPMYFYIPFVFTCMLIVTVYTYLKLGKQLRQGAPVKQSIPVGLGVLIISGFGCNVFAMISLVSSAVLMSVNEPHGGFLPGLPDVVPYLIDIASAVITLVQIGLQMKTIFLIHWLKRRGGRDDILATEIVQPAVFLLVMNFSQWLCDTVVESKFLGFWHSECVFFGARTWDTIIQAVFPFILYFRFHSAMAFAEFLLWKRRSLRRLRLELPDMERGTYEPMITTFV